MHMTTMGGLAAPALDGFEAYDGCAREVRSGRVVVAAGRRLVAHLLVDRGARRPRRAPVLPARDRCRHLLEIGERHAVRDEARRPVGDRCLDAWIYFGFGLDDCGHVFRFLY